MLRLSYPGKLGLRVRKLAKKLVLSHTQLLCLDVNSISRPESELPTTPTKMCSKREQIPRWSSPGHNRGSVTRLKYLPETLRLSGTAGTGCLPGAVVESKATDVCGERHG